MTWFRSFLLLFFFRNNYFEFNWIFSFSKVFCESLLLRSHQYIGFWSICVFFSSTLCKVLKLCWEISSFVFATLVFKQVISYKHIHVDSRHTHAYYIACSHATSHIWLDSSFGRSFLFSSFNFSMVFCCVWVRCCLLFHLLFHFTLVLRPLLLCGDSSLFWFFGECSIPTAEQ